MKTPAQMAEGLAELSGLLAENGRSRDEIEVSVMPGPDFSADDLLAYRDAGVDQVVVLGVAPNAEAVRSVFEPMAEALVVPATRI